MGKKVRKAARSGQKGKRGPSASPKIAVQKDTRAAETPGNGVSDVKDRGSCSHIDKGINLDKLSTKLGSSDSVTCEDCRGSVDGRIKKGKGKQGKSKSESKAIWICLECGHFSCGGVGLPTTLNSHAVRHAKQNHHPLVIHHENHQLLWCFSCSKLISAEISDDCKHKDVLNEVHKILKRRTSGGSTVDVEGVWFGSGSVTSSVKLDYSLGVDTNERAGFSVRGLVNLGNTCFFNSIMQNLLAIDSFRDYYFNLDESFGPLSAAIKKFFHETSSETNSRSAINPRSLFGSLCVKAPQFRGYQQHDSHELLRCLLDGLSSEELSARKHTKSNDVSNTDPTFVDAVFGGKLSSTVSCLECGHSSTIYEPFLDLSLPVPTKKPPARRIQPATRGKKPKLPPKRSGKNTSKINKEVSAVRGDGASVRSTSENSSGELPTATPAEDLSSIQNPEDQQTAQNAGEQSHSSDNFAFAWLDFLDSDPVSQDDDVASEIDAVSANQGFTNQDSLPADTPLSITLNSTDDDLGNAVSASSFNDAEKFNSLEPGVPMQVMCQLEDKQNAKPQCDQMTTAECTSEEVLYDADLSYSYESCQQVCSKDSNASFRNNELPSQIQDVKLQLSETPSKNSTHEELFHCGAEIKPIAESCKQACTGDSNASGRNNELTLNVQHSKDNKDGGLPNEKGVSSSGNVLQSKYEVSPVLAKNDGRDGEHPSQIQDSEIRLLPSKGDASTGEQLGTELDVSSLALGDEQDYLGFDGFGDLFNEPDISLDHKPLDHSDGNDGKPKVIGNCSDSDPDEVDNADAPVSIESCLALFTKPELLSKDEHAWQCDNCSKILQEKRNRLRGKTQMSMSDTVSNGCQDRNLHGLVDASNKPRTMNENLKTEADFSDGMLLEKNERKYENGKCIVGNHSEDGINMAEFHSEGAEPQMKNECPGTVECSPPFGNAKLNPCHGDRDSDKHGVSNRNLDSRKYESEGNGPNEASSEFFKVKRDATKSILINKSPPILTVHLKRFSQDARGRLSKLNGHVNFRETLDLKPYMDSRCSENNNKFKYRLVGVVEHLGTMRGGHYIAYVRGTKKLGDCVWYHASDAYVREASLEEVLRCEAYILFYQRN
ncbi:ubiquitin carboxyl-terminal hydrolase 2 [Andrographis paniculata]|uniref:ubiquitin carboxyl-terminal hydrolase 2 n=1 Tax=Andrographis paniculata TaxID=175694 RepID=UPI0021E75530|nr:ubiquitin carboxyl-terminal hydrolase 2 [Andrographis paniculata]XP_051133200.1 ubiquitin carboxyl-terminal hydrolase 2 [Andrographis paniculata]